MNRLTGNRFAGFLACFLVAWDCADKALGNTAQELFSQQTIWVWWIISVLWAWNAFIQLIRD